jgi:flagellar basal body-associated protein FliL
MGKNIFYFIVVIVILLLVGGVVFTFTQQNKQEPQRSSVPAAPAEVGLGSQLNQNPGSEVPETNPFQGETNPFEGYTNPFK